MKHFFFILILFSLNTVIAYPSSSPPSSDENTVLAVDLDLDIQFIDLSNLACSAEYPLFEFSVFENCQNQLIQLAFSLHHGTLYHQNAAYYAKDFLNDNAKMMTANVDFKTAYDVFKVGWIG